MMPLSHVTSVVAVLSALYIIGAYGAGVRPRHECTLRDQFGDWYSDESTPCTKEYEVCRSFVWRKSKCVLGHFNFTMGHCQRFNDGSGCELNDNSLVTSGRKRREVAEEIERNVEQREMEHKLYKRQAVNCPAATYQCPSNVAQVAQFPDWNNVACTSYNLCLAGTLTQQNCGPSPYVFYNPRLLSCEEYPALSNTCVWREWADVTPFDGTKI